MRRTIFLLLLSLVMLSTSLSSAKDIYGFVTGSGDTNKWPIGMYKYETKEGVLTTLQPLQFMFWGGAYANGRYYMMLSDDYAGNMFEGLCSYNLSDNTADIGSLYQEYGCADMTYDYSTSTMYGIMVINGGAPTKSTLVSIDLNTGDKKTIASISENVKALACTYFGDLYAMTANGQLCLLNKDNGRLTYIGETGIVTSSTEAQSMEFDRSTNQLYWSGLDANEDVFLAHVNTENGSIIERQGLPDNTLLVGLHIPFTPAEPKAPARCTELSARADGNNVTLSWKNPEKDFAGEALSTPLTKIEIVRNNNVVGTINEVSAGEKMTWKDTVTTTLKGMTRYIVYAYNATGRGDAASTQVMIGDDVPQKVDSLKLKKEDEKAHLSWTAPVSGQNGGSINPSTLGYKITRHPDDIVVGDVKATSFVDQTISRPCYYSYSVVAYNATGESDETITDTLALGPEVVPPYTADFKTKLGAAQWHIADGNKDGSTWKYSSSNGTFSYFTSFFNAANDSLVSVPFELKKDVTYELSYTISAPSVLGSSEKLQLCATKAGVSTQIETLDNYSTEKSETRNSRFNVTENGSYQLALVALSNADQNQIIISGLSIKALTTLDLGIETVEGPDALTKNKKEEYQVKVKNYGTQPVENANVQITDDKGKLYTSAAIKEQIEPGASITISLYVTPTDVSVSHYKFIVNTVGDGNIRNNILTRNVSVIEDNEAYIEMGGKDATPNLIPFAFEGNKYSYTQTIYRENELNVSSSWIKEIQYEYNNASDTIKDRHIKVYMSNSENEDVSTGWTNDNQMTLVFDGKVTFIPGNNMLRLTLDKAFEYTGRDLRVMCQKIDDDTQAAITFFATNTEVGRTTLFNDAKNGDVNTEQVLISTMLPFTRIVVSNDKGLGIGSSLEVANNFFHVKKDFIVANDGIAESIELYTTDGKRVAFVNHSKLLSIKGIHTGLYLVRVTSLNGQKIGKIVLK